MWAGRVLPPDRLAPHEEARLVAQVQEARVLRVVAAAHEVGAEILEDLHVRRQQRLRQPAAELRVRVVAVEAEQAQRLAVEQDVAAAGP